MLGLTWIGLGLRAFLFRPMFENWRCSCLTHLLELIWLYKCISQWEEHFLENMLFRRLKNKSSVSLSAPGFVKPPDRYKWIYRWQRDHLSFGLYLALGKLHCVLFVGRWWSPLPFPVQVALGYYFLSIIQVKTRDQRPWWGSSVCDKGFRGFMHTACILQGMKNYKPHHNWVAGFFKAINLKHAL